MKKLIALILSAVMLLTLVPAAVLAAPTADEVGKVAAGYTPSGTGIDDLAKITDVNGTYYLTKDVTASATIAEFKGTLDGNGHTVTVSAPLFGELSGAVKNLTLAGTVPAPAASEHTGALAKTSSAALTVENVKNTAAVSGVLVDLSTDLFATAGFIGKVTGNLTVTSCANTGDVHGQAAGGFVGYINGEVTVKFKSCVNTGKVYTTGCGTTNYFADVVDEATDKVYFGIGGIAGTTNGKSSVTFEDCKNTGVIDATALKIPSGGILGASHIIDTTEKAAGRSVTFTNCENTAEIAGSWQTGGIGGWIAAASNTEGCKNSGKVSSSKSYSGGIHGRVNADKAVLAHTIKGCSNSGEVTSATGPVAGILGFAKFLKLDVGNCTNSGKIITAATHVGGIIGSFEPTEDCTVTNCTNSGELVGPSDNKGCVAGIIGNFGKNGQVAKLTIENAINSGKIVSGGLDTAGILAASCGHVVIRNSVNTGDITNTANRAGGIYGASSKQGENSLLLDKCVNYGTVKGFSRIAGIASLFGNVDAKGAYVVQNCVNLGEVKADLTAKNHVVGGIVAYAHGGKTGANGIINCHNYGNITITAPENYAAEIFTGGILGYVDTDTYNVKNCVNAGTISVGTTGAKVLTFHLFHNKNATGCTGDYIKNNFYYGNDGLTVDLNGTQAVNGVAITADVVASGKLAYDFNQAAGETILYQTIGTDAIPTAKNTSKVVYLVNNTYTNTDPAATTTPPAETTAPPAETTTPPAGGTTPSTPVPTGDSVVAIVLALVAVSFGAVLTMKKRIR